MAGVGKDGLDQSWMVEHGVARFSVAEEVDQRNPIVRRTGQRAHDKLKIRRREPRPTIRLDHRSPIISFPRARGQGSSWPLSREIAQSAQTWQEEIRASPHRDELG